MACWYFPVWPLNLVISYFICTEIWCLWNLKFCYSKCQYQRKQFMFKCHNFDLDIDLSQSHKYSYIYFIKVNSKWQHVVCCHVGIWANPVGFEHCFYVNNLCSPSKFTYPSITWVNCTLQWLHRSWLNADCRPCRLQTEQAVQLLCLLFLKLWFTFD